MAAPSRYNPDTDTLKQYHFRRGKHNDDWVWSNKERIIMISLLPECASDFCKIFYKLGERIIPQAGQFLTAETREQWLNQLPDLGYK